LDNQGLDVEASSPLRLLPNFASLVRGCVPYAFRFTYSPTQHGNKTSPDPFGFRLNCQKTVTIYKWNIPNVDNSVNKKVTKCERFLL
jgi:hypothetical protein